MRVEEEGSSLLNISRRIKFLIDLFFWENLGNRIFSSIKITI
jgi:hypothetical protein